MEDLKKVLSLKSKADPRCKAIRKEIRMLSLRIERLASNVAGSKMASGAESSDISVLKNRKKELRRWLDARIRQIKTEIRGVDEIIKVPKPPRFKSIEAKADKTLETKLSQLLDERKALKSRTGYDLRHYDDFILGIRTILSKRQAIKGKRNDKSRYGFEKERVVVCTKDGTRKTLKDYYQHI